MSMSKRKYEELLDAEAKRCSECGKDDAYDIEAIEDQPQAACDCGVYEWWCSTCLRGYDGDYCEKCLERTLASGG